MPEHRDASIHTLNKCQARVRCQQSSRSMDGSTLEMIPPRLLGSEARPSAFVQDHSNSGPMEKASIGLDEIGLKYSSSIIII